jgi:hypothetical protein
MYHKVTAALMVLLPLASIPMPAAALTGIQA